MNSNFQNSLKAISECPVCRKKHFAADIKLIEESENGHLLHIRCKECQASLLVLVSLSESGMNLIGVLTDLSGDEVKKYLDSPAIDSEQILNLYEKFNNNKYLEIIK